MKLQKYLYFLRSLIFSNQIISLLKSNPFDISKFENWMEIWLQFYMALLIFFKSMQIQFLIAIVANIRMPGESLHSYFSLELPCLLIFSPSLQVRQAESATVNSERILFTYLTCLWPAIPRKQTFYFRFLKFNFLQCLSATGICFDLPNKNIKLCLWL